MGQPNIRLTAWWSRTGWSRAELRRRVIRRAEQLGHKNIVPTVTRVSQWLDHGERPREPTPAILAEVFSEHFGHKVTPADLGFGPPTSTAVAQGLDYPWTADAVVAGIGDLTKDDLTVNRRNLISGASSIAAASTLVQPLRRWISARPTFTSGRAPMRIGTADLDAMEAHARECRELANRHGGITFRRAAIGQLSHTTDLLQYAHPAGTTRRLYGVLAVLGESAGIMSEDAGQNDRAQKYYVLALRAATEAGDRRLGAHLLASMASQMMELGHPRDALDLVDLARRGATGHLTPALDSLLRIRESWALVKVGDLTQARRAVDLAEDAYQGTTPSEEPQWLSYLDASEFHGVCGSRYRDLKKAGRANLDRSAAHYAKALELRNPRYLRPRALDLTGLAKIHLLRDEVEEACSTAHRALDLAGQLSSGVLDGRLSEFQSQAAPYADTTAVREFNDRAYEVLGLTA